MIGLVSPLPYVIQMINNLAITDGEIHFLWWFIQGSIMTPETRGELLRTYGLCERHAWVHLSAEMAYRKRHFRGPVLYRSLLEKSVQAIAVRQHVGSRSPLRQLQGTGRCFLCALNIHSASAGAAPPARLERGRDSAGLRAFAARMATLWRPMVCAICANGARDAIPSSRCRRHFVTDLKAHNPIDLSRHQAVLQDLAASLARYEGPLWREPTSRPTGIAQPSFQRPAGAAAGVPCSLC
jgi:hypothetical protein